MSQRFFLVHSEEDSQKLITCPEANAGSKGGRGRYKKPVSKSESRFFWYFCLVLTILVPYFFVCVHIYILSTHGPLTRILVKL